MFKKLSSLVSATCVAFTLVASWMLSLRPVSAADIIVHPGESIQAAIDSASPGDTIIIQPGIYTEVLTLNKPVSLTGVSSDTVILILPPNTSNGVWHLTIDGSTITPDVIIAHLTFNNHHQTQNTRGINIINSAQPTLYDLTITNYSWGLLINQENSTLETPLTFSHLLFEDNELGFWYDRGPITMTHSLFRNSHGIFGGGQATMQNTQFEGEGVIYVIDGVTISDSILEQGDIFLTSKGHLSISNTAILSATNLEIEANSIEIDNSTIINNQSCPTSWPTIWTDTFYATETLTIKDSIISDNFTPNNCQNSSFIWANETVIENSTITNNEIPSTTTLFFILDGGLTINSSTITNNVGFIQSFGDMVINQSYLAHNEAEPGYDNIFFSGSNLTVTESSLINNNGVWGAGQNAYITNSQIITGAYAIIGQDLTLINSTLSGHTQLYPPAPDPEYPNGYGVFQVNGSAYISNSHITNNLSTQCNGSSAFYLYNYGDATILDSTFANNQAHCPEHPGSNYPPNGSAVTAGSTIIENSQFINNQATGFATEGSAVWSFVMTITDSYFEGNNVEQIGSAIYGGMLSITNSTFISHTGPGCVVESYYLTVNQTEFANNQTDQAVLCGPSFSEIKDPEFLDLNQSRFMDNDSPAVVSSAFVTITNSLFAHNTPAEPNQPIIEINQGHLTLHHNTIAHESLLNHPAVVAYTSSVTVENNIINNFEVGLMGYNSTLAEDYNLLNNSSNISWDSPVVPGSHTLLNLNPGFNNPAGNNFTLLPSSPAINKGIDLGYLLDLDGNNRLQSTAPDLGALESPFTGQPMGIFRLNPAALTLHETVLSAVVTITLDQPLTFTTQVSYQTQDGTATAGEDYQPLNDTLTFAPGSIAQTITVVLLDDALFEANETFALSLHNPVSGVLGVPHTAVITLLSEDAPPPDPITPTVQFVQASYSVSETAGQLMVNVTLDQPVPQTVTVDFLSTNGTATAGADYESLTGTLTFWPGTTSQNITVTVLDDTLFEANETFALSLHNPVSAVLGTPHTTHITILSEDAPPPDPITPTVQFSHASYTTTEEAGSLLLTISLSETVAHTITVHLYTTAGSALPGSDYQSFTHTLVFAPGQLTQTVAISIVNDELPEPTEWLTVTLANPAGAIVGTPSQTEVHILDSDTPPPVSHQVYLPVLLRP